MELYQLVLYTISSIIIIGMWGTTQEPQEPPKPPKGPRKEERGKRKEEGATPPLACGPGDPRGQQWSMLQNPPRYWTPTISVRARASWPHDGIPYRAEIARLLP
jgi:hypothetical protein